MKAKNNVCYFFVMVVLLNACAYSIPEKQGLILAPKEFKKAMEETPGIVIDFRTPEEFGQERLLWAINMNYEDEEFKRQIKTLDKLENYFLYCGTGKISAMAMNTMFQYGFRHMFVLKGGLAAWKEEGLPVVRPVLEAHHREK